MYIYIYVYIYIQNGSRHDKSVSQHGLNGSQHGMNGGGYTPRRSVAQAAGPNTPRGVASPRHYSYAQHQQASFAQ